MDSLLHFFGSFSGTIAHVLGWAITAVSGAGFTYLITNWAKISPYIPITEGRKEQVRTFAGITAAISVIALSFVNPDIRPEDLQGAILTVLTFAASWFGAHKINEAAR
jgi:ABC-type lipoprotein release transport system permease subunit